MPTGFAIFVPHSKRFNALAVYYGKAYSIRDNLKTTAGGHAVHE